MRKKRINVTPPQCENRWRVLERAYKKFIDASKKTGRARQYFEYENEMNHVFCGKKFILNFLSTDTILSLPECLKTNKNTSKKL